MFEIMMGSLITTPLIMFLIVLFGLAKLFLSPSFVTNALSGVIVAHLTPTKCYFKAKAASKVILSLVSSLF